MRMILNADDFGQTEDTVEATIECFEQGALTSASIMVDTPATEQAVDYARTRPEASFGVHLVFVGDEGERPLSPQAEVPGLVDDEGRLFPANVVRARALLGRIPFHEIEREAERQINRLVELGLSPTHVDSHCHVHKFGPFREALARVLPRFGITRVRNVQDLYLRKPLASPTYWLGGLWRRALMQTFATTDHFYMPTSAHDVAWPRPLLAAAARLDGVLEIAVHPGRAEDWRRDEQRSLLDFSNRAREAGHELVPWTGLESDERTTGAELVGSPPA
jgi:chitin disaccharide deacetylase